VPLLISTVLIIEGSKGTIAGLTCPVKTFQPIKLESCSNPLEKQRVS